MKDRPVILEPSFYKYEDTAYKQLGTQWQVFHECLLDADCIVVIGYSLPEMDINARSKIMTAFQVNHECRWLVIDPTESVCNHYRRLLGHEHVTVLQQTLTGFNNYTLIHLQSAFPTTDFSA